jgi:hypothetical protein
MAVPLALGDELSSGLDLMRVFDAAAPSTDRRRRTRLKLSWAVLLRMRTGSQPIEGWTKDVSSDGFYCFAPEPLDIDVDASFTISVPVFDAERRRDMFRLDGKARVVRVEPLGNGLYGIACRIEDYRVHCHPESA